MNTQLLENGLTELNLDTVIAKKLEQYMSLIEEANKTHSFVNAEGDTLIIKHILDSLAGAHIINTLAKKSSNGQTSSLIDIGSGAGLPGIPLAIEYPELNITLLDRMTKRIEFLEKAKENLQLCNVSVIEAQAEHIKTKYDIITFRAFRPFEYKLFKKIFGLCKKQGFLVAYKGQTSKVEDELKQIDGLYKKVEIIPIKVPFLDEHRCLAIFEPS